MYTLDGIKVLCPTTRQMRSVEWDSVRRCRVGGMQVVRCRVRLRNEHFPLYVPGNGLGGFQRARDAGSELIVDFLPDGRKVDHLVRPKS